MSHFHMGGFTRCLFLVGLLLGSANVLQSAEPEQVRFSRHVLAVFSRLGCNGGQCHGAVQGKNGFRLSLFGADPDLDHERLLRSDGGRRLNLLDPEQSLLLLKASGQLPHEGGRRTAPGSPEYQILRQWIERGAPGDAARESQVTELKITPTEKAARTGESYSLRVDARFADGSTQDVTPLCSFESRDAQTASVDANGVVRVHAVGETALIVRYRSDPAIAHVLVPRLPPPSPPGGENVGKIKPGNFIDGHILAKLQRMNLTPAALADDSTFLRRVSLDVAGELPTAQEVRDFLADGQPDRRARKIDELLGRRGHAALWTLKFCDLLKASDWGEFGLAYSMERDAPRFQAWVRARLEENLPYDQFAERILIATSRQGASLEDYAKELLAWQENYGPQRPDLDLYRQRKTPDVYWQRRESSGIAGTLQVAHAFLGLRLECAQCHRHPHDVWQQDDLLSFANFFMGVREVKSDPQNLQRYPEHFALGKKYDEEGKKLGTLIKQRREGEGKKFEADAREARTKLDQVNKEITKLESDARRLLEKFKDKNAEAEAITRQVAALREKTVGFQGAVRRQEDFTKEMSRLQKRINAIGTLNNRLVNGEVHVVKKPPVASVSSPLGKQTSKVFRLLAETQPVTVEADRDPRTVVAQWLRKPDNPFFARALVNRVWAHYFGRGIVDPPDNLSPYNPATHPELLKELSDGFIRNGFDLKWLHRTILTSRTYQQSSTPAPGTGADRTNYAYFHLRRLPAEVLLDAFTQATGIPDGMNMERYHWPPMMKAVEVPYMPENSFVSFMLENFGRPKRNTSVQCDCQRESGATMLQVLSLANHPRVWEKVNDPKGFAARVTKEKVEENERIDELYYATLSRLPTAMERQACRRFLASAATPLQGTQAILWGLVNTKEFLLQH